MEAITKSLYDIFIEHHYWFDYTEEPAPEKWMQYQQEMKTAASDFAIRLHSLGERWSYAVEANIIELNTNTPPPSILWNKSKMEVYNLEKKEFSILVRYALRNNGFSENELLEKLSSKAMAFMGIEVFGWRTKKKQPINRPDILIDILITDEQKQAWKKAIKNGFMEPTPNGFKWKLEPDCTLAYFCGKLFGYKRVNNNGILQNVGGQVPYDKLQSLFNKKRLDRALSQLYDAQKPQLWRKQIDELFN